MIIQVYNYIIILVNPLPGVETNIYLVCRFTCLLVGWLAGLLICLFAYWPVCWFAWLLVGRFTYLLVGWLTGLLICLFAVLKAAGVQLAGLLVSWLAGWLE